MNGIAGNWKHMITRSSERLVNKDVALVERVIKGLANRIKTGKAMPNRDWYRAVVNKHDVVAYVCGQGTHISTILGASMSPRGEKV